MTAPTIPAGTVMVITQCQYSDYHVIGIYRALKDIAVAERVKTTPKPEYLGMAFIATLIADGSLEALGDFEWNLGDTFDWGHVNGHEIK